MDESQRIKEALEAVDMYGPCGCAVVSMEVNVEVTNASKYCQRAVSYGLMTVVKPEKRGQYKSFALYSVVPGWRSMLGSFRIEDRVRAKPLTQNKERRIVKNTFSGIGSIFQLGGV